jgi:hypothetical protein
LAAQLRVAPLDLVRGVDQRARELGHLADARAYLERPRVGAERLRSRGDGAHRPRDAAADVEREAERRGEREEHARAHQPGRAVRAAEHQLARDGEAHRPARQVGGGVRGERVGAVERHAAIPALARAARGGEIVAARLGADRPGRHARDQQAVRVGQPARPAFGQPLVGDQRLERLRVDDRGEDVGEAPVAQHRHAHRDVRPPDERTAVDDQSADRRPQGRYDLTQRLELHRVTGQRRAPRHGGVDQLAPIGIQHDDIQPRSLRSKRRDQRLVEAAQVAAREHARGRQRLQRDDGALQLRVDRRHERAVAILHGGDEVAFLVADQQRRGEERHREQRHRGRDDEEDEARTEAHGERHTVSRHERYPM